MYDLVIEMNARQQVLERRTDNIEEGLSRLQVGLYPPTHDKTAFTLTVAQVRFALVGLVRVASARVP